MKTYIDSGNYYGDQYHQFLEEQQKASDFWCSTFYPLDLPDMKAVQKNISEKVNTSLNKAKEVLDIYTQVII